MSRPSRAPHPSRPRTPAGLLATAALALAGCGGADGASRDDEVELSHIRLVDVTADSGIGIENISGDPRRLYILESNGCGAAWLDYEGDGDMDLFVGNGQGVRYVELEPEGDGPIRKLETYPGPSSRFYRNDGRFRFSDVTLAVGARRDEWINAVATGDVDNDGDTDIYLACFGNDAFLRRDITFTEAAEASGLDNPYWGAGAVFGDANLDGNLDLYVSNYVRFDLDDLPAGGRPAAVEGGVEIGYGPEGENGQGINPGAPDLFFLGNGHGTFVEATERAGLTLEKDLCSYACVFSDVDNDGWPDILVANDLQPCNLFMNKRGTFVDEAVERGFAFNGEGKATSAMGLFVEDIDGDGDSDVLRTNFDMEPNCLHVNDGKGYFLERGKSHGIAACSMDRLGWGGGFLDADLDGYVDVLIANGHVMPHGEVLGMNAWAQKSQLLRGVHHRRFGIEFEDISEATGDGLQTLRSARGVAFADVDDDGDSDAIIIDIGERPRLLENRSARNGHWIGIRTIGKWSNRDGYGARITVRAGKQTWTREMRTPNGLYSAHDPRLIIGLGRIDAVDEVEIRWPSGSSQTLQSPELDRVHVITESRVGR